MTNVYFVGTPIGNLKDISFRAIETLKNSDYILCEDTRITSRLLDQYSIDYKSKLKVYNDHNASSVIHKIIEDILANGSVYSFVSDAGMPLVSDPGFKLTQALWDNNVKYSVIPGASATLAALVLSGFPSDKIMFCGFFDSKKAKEFININSTLIFFESPRRLIETLTTMKETFYNRDVAVIREITKIYEETIRGSLDDVTTHFKQNEPRGEIVVVLSPPKEEQTNMTEIKELIKYFHGKFSSKEISDIISRTKSVSKNTVYKMVLEFDRNDV